MLAWAIDNDPVAVTEGEFLPPLLIEMLADPGTQKIAWNAPFEIAVLLHRFGIHTSYGHWFDPVIFARYLTLPATLAGCSAALGLEVQKDTRGKRLLRMFSQPARATAKQIKDGLPSAYWRDAASDPEDWAALSSTTAGPMSP